MGFLRRASNPMSMRFRTAACIFICSVPFSHGGAQVFTFSNDLEKWNLLNDVTVVADSVRFADDDLFATLWRGFPVNPGLPVEIQFEFLSTGLAGPASVGGSPDAFFVSLYFTNGLNAFDPLAPAFERSYDLLDLFPGQILLTSDANVGPSLRGGSWQTFTWDVAAAESHAVVVFDLLDTNGNPGDSVLVLDDVMLASIPESSSFGLFLLIFTAGLTFRRRRPPFGQLSGIQS